MDVKLHDTLEQEMLDFIGDIQQRSHDDVSAVLAELTERAVRLIPAVEHAGITVSNKGEVRSESSSGPFPAELDRIQVECGTGPCLCAVEDDGLVRVDDVEHDYRWPRYSSAVVDRTPIRSVLSVAVVSDSPGVSAVNVYAEKPNAFDVGTTRAVQTFAAYAGVAWTMARRDKQFREALASRHVIGQAKGMIMERFGVDAAQAFDLLKRLSQSSNTPLARIAGELVEAERGK